MQCQMQSCHACQVPKISDGLQTHPNRHLSCNLVPRSTALGSLGTQSTPLSFSTNPNCSAVAGRLAHRCPPCRRSMCPPHWSARSESESSTSPNVPMLPYRVSENGHLSTCAQFNTTWKMHGGNSFTHSWIKQSAWATHEISLHEHVTSPIKKIVCS